METLTTKIKTKVAVDILTREENRGRRQASGRRDVSVWARKKWRNGWGPFWEVEQREGLKQRCTDPRDHPMPAKKANDARDHGKTKSCERTHDRNRGKQKGKN